MNPSLKCALVAIAGTALLGAVAASSQTSTNDRERRPPSSLLPLEERWTVPLPGAPSAAPVATADRIFVPLRDGHVVAVSLVDGTEVWQIEQPVVGQPTVGGDLLYLASHAELRGLDTGTGGFRWSVPLESALSAPLVWNAGWLIVALEANSLLALRAESGETLWRQNFDGGIRVTPALAGDRIYVSLDTGWVVALALLTGETVWAQRLEGAPQEILPLDDLFVGATDNYFYRLSVADGSIVWRWRAGGDVVGRPAVDQKHVYFSSLDNMLWALNRTNGVQQWRQSLASRPTAGPRHVKDLLMQSVRSDQLSFFGPIDGTLYGRTPAPSELAFAPLSRTDPAGDGRLVVMVSGDGQLRAFGPATGPLRLDPALTTVLEKNFDLPAGATPGAPPPTAPASVPGGPVATPPGPATSDPVAPAPPSTPSGPVETPAGPVPTDPASAPPVSAPSAPVETPLNGPVEAGATPSTEAVAALSTEPSATPTTVGGEYAHQVASLADAANATAMAKRLVAQGYSAFVLEPRETDDPPLFRVRIGDYPDRAMAEPEARRLEAEQRLD